MSVRKKKQKKRFSSEYTMLSILEYLYVNAQDIPVTKYKVLTNGYEIRLQRPDRVNNIMEILEQNGYVKSIVAYRHIQDKIIRYSKYIPKITAGLLAVMAIAFATGIMTR